MNTCADCACCDPIDDTYGRCKKNRVERHVVLKESHSHEIVNGWPVVDMSEARCVNDFE